MVEVGEIRTIQGKRAVAIEWDKDCSDCCFVGDCGNVDCYGVKWKEQPPKTGVPTRETLEVGDVLRCGEESCIDTVTAVGRDNFLFVCSKDDIEKEYNINLLHKFTYQALADPEPEEEEVTIKISKSSFEALKESGIKIVEGM